MDATTTTEATYTVTKPRLHRVPAEYCGGYTTKLVDAYGDTRTYLVRRDLHNPAWGWNVYTTHHEDQYRWALIIDQMSSLDYALRVAVGHSLTRGLNTVFASQVEWAAK